MTGVVNHQQLVGLVADRLDPAGELTVADVLQVVRHEGLHAAALGRVEVARAVARPVDEHPVPRQGARFQLSHRRGDAVVRGRLVAQQRDVGGGHLQRGGHRQRIAHVVREAVERLDAPPRIDLVAADADDQRVAVAAWRQAARAERDGARALRAPAGFELAHHGHLGGAQVEQRSPQPAAQAGWRRLAPGRVRRHRHHLHLRPAAAELQQVHRRIGRQRGERDGVWRALAAQRRGLHGAHRLRRCG